MTSIRMNLRIAMAVCALVVAGIARGQSKGPLEVKGPLLATQSLAALQSPAVQKELKLTPEQSDRVRAIGARAVSELQAKARGARRNPLAALNADRIRRDAMEKWDAATDSALAVLDASQVKRLEEVCLQIGGPLAAANRELEDDLRITKSQRDRIDGEVKRLRGDLKRADNPKAKSDRVKQTQDRVAALLNDEQRQLLRTLKGAPFALPTGDEDSHH